MIVVPSWSSAVSSPDVHEHKMLLEEELGLSHGVTYPAGARSAATWC